MKASIVLAALLTAASARAQSARKQPEPGYIPSPPAISQVGNPYPPTAYQGQSQPADPRVGDTYYSPNTFQGPGQSGYGASLPAGTQPGNANAAAANTQAQATSQEGRIYHTNLDDYNTFPSQRSTPALIGPQAPHRMLPRPLVEPLPPDYNTPAPPPQGGTNIQRGAPQGANPATNASPQGLSPEKQVPTTGQPANAGQMLQPRP